MKIIQQYLTMKKGKNQFVNKFQLLNSQENSQEIIWSSSDSSDYENIYGNERLENKKNVVDSRKRKRIDRRYKSLKNISNLDITYAENSKDTKETNKTSPIINRKVTKCLSPILFSSQQNNVKKSPDINNLQKSPILSFTQSINHNKDMKSPILLSKCKSPKYSPKIRKKLFHNSHNEVDFNYNTFAKNNDNCIAHAKDCTRIKGELMFSHSSHKQKQESNLISNNLVENIIDESNKDLVKIVKSYFNSHFSLETNSQNSISEYDSTPKNTSKTSEEIDIISLSDEDKSNIELNSKDTIKEDSNNMAFKYKKDGMAYRLDVLLKKQNASISLWQHEKYLANNSKFVIPKGDYTPFRIINVQFKYGCYILQSRDVHNDSYFIIINNMYVSNVIEPNMLLKLYQPYRFLNVKDCKLIVNAFKFECDKMDLI